MLHRSCSLWRQARPQPRPLRPSSSVVGRWRAAGSVAHAASGASLDCDVAVVGAGFAGLYALHRLRGLGVRATVLEAGGGVGGTWFWNRYPGARCDIQSLEYSYQFDTALAQEWRWSERYATQPEILRYIEHVADRFDLHRDIRLNTQVLSAEFEEPGAWTLETSSGRVRAQFCIMALGCLSAANLPCIKGIQTFRGPSYHTGRWPANGADLAGRRVAVVGTGSSGVQAIPRLAEVASELLVFQRTAGFVVPAWNAPLSEAYAAEVRAKYSEFRAVAKTTPNGHHPGPLGLATTSALSVSHQARAEEYERRWANGGLSFLNAFTDLVTDLEANRTASDFVRSKIRETVRDEATAELLCPKDVIGGKRLCVGTDYYETFNRPSVRLVDASGGIEEVTERGLQVAGREYEVDCIVFATGYDAMTGPLLRIDVRGRAGVLLRETWAEGPVTYLGLAVPGFPNLFTVTGPGSPSVLTNMVPSIEQHVDWIASLLAHLRTSPTLPTCVEASPEASAAWGRHVAEAAGSSLRSSAGSWYLGANVEGKPRVFMPYIGGFPAYARRCDEVAARGYEGFLFSAPHSPP